MKKRAKKRYFIKNCDITAGDPWIELTGKEFYQLTTSDKGKTMMFAKVGEYIIETTDKKIFKSTESYRKHALYLYQFAEDVDEMSIYDSDYIQQYEQCREESEIDVEEKAINNTMVYHLHQALQELADDEYGLIYDLFLADNVKTERQLAKEKGVTQNTINYHKKKIFQKIQKIFYQIQKK